MSSPIIRVLGPNITTPGKCDFKQLPCNLHGVGVLRDLPEATIAVVWPDRYFFQLPDPKQIANLPLFRSDPDLKAVMAEFARTYYDQEKPQAKKCRSSHNVGETSFYRFLEEQMREDCDRFVTPRLSPDSDKGKKARIYYKTILPRVAGLLMRSLFAVAAHGGLAVLVMSPEMNDGTSFCPQVNDFLWGCFCDPAEENFAPTISQEVDRYRGLWLDFTVSHISLIDKWPFYIGFRHGGNSRRIGKFPIKMIVPSEESESPVVFYPGATNSSGDAKSLVMRHGKGQVMLIPEPKNLQVVLKSAIKCFASSPIDIASTQDVALLTPSRPEALKDEAIGTPGAATASDLIKSINITTVIKKIAGQKRSWLVRMTLNNGTEIPVPMGPRAFPIFLSFVLASQTSNKDPVITVFEPMIKGQSIKQMFPAMKETTRIYRTVQYVQDAFDKACERAGHPKLKIKLIENVKSAEAAGCYRLIPALRNRIQSKALQTFLGNEPIKCPAEDEVLELYRIAGKILI